MGYKNWNRNPLEHNFSVKKKKNQNRALKIKMGLELKK